MARRSVTTGEREEDTMRDEEFIGVDHDQALLLAVEYAREHGKPFVVVGQAGHGFGVVAEEDLAEMRETLAGFAAATARPPVLVTTYRVAPDGALQAA